MNDMYVECTCSRKARRAQTARAMARTMARKRARAAEREDEDEAEGPSGEDEDEDDKTSDDEKDDGKEQAASTNLRGMSEPQMKVILIDPDLDDWFRWLCREGL